MEINYKSKQYNLKLTEDEFQVFLRESHSMMELLSKDKTLDEVLNKDIPVISLIHALGFAITDQAKQYPNHKLRIKHKTEWKESTK